MSRKNVIVVGGGIAGLAASIILARRGRTVTIFEKRQSLGGRAVTHLRQGYRFNLGAHALYRGGGAAAVYRELGIPVRGGVPKPGGVALHGGDEYKLPVRIWSLLTSGIIGVKSKLALASLMFRLRRLDPRPFEHMTAQEWLDAHVSDPQLRVVVAALMRLATYTHRLDEMSAAAALAQMRVAQRGVTYVDEGWQKIVDSLHSAAVAAGVNFVTSSRIVGIGVSDGHVRSVELGGLELDAHRMDTMSIALPEAAPDDVQGVPLKADAILLAIDPQTAAELVDNAEITRSWTAATPVTASCLDVALSRLPDPKRLFAIGIDQPLYFSVHSAWAQLTPRGGALIHAARYGGGDEKELEALIDRMQPGWRDVLVHRRFLPSMTVSNALVRPGVPRPEPVTPIRGLYIAGDWVGSGGVLSDAALTSARAAANAILAADS